MEPSNIENAAYRLCEERRVHLDGQFPQLADDSPQITELEQSLTVVGISTEELGNLVRLYKDEEDIRGRLAQIGLSLSAFLRLSELYRLVKIASSIPDEELDSSEWDEIRNILIGIYKNRRFGTWRREEKGGWDKCKPQLFQTT